MLPPLTTAPFFLIAGPCVIESLDLCLTVASHIQSICQKLQIPYIFKASFDKANRSSGQSFRGPGIDEGLAVLAQVKKKLNLPVLTDIHETAHVAKVAEVVDVLQIPAFLARQTDLLLAAAATGRAINVKKGQFMSPQEMGNAVEKIRAASPAPAPLWLTERGTFFGYNRLVNDFTAIPIMQSFNCPVVFDVTHSTQQPAAQGHSSGGNPHFSPMLARAALAAGADALFIEAHPNPKAAKSDASTMLHLNALDTLLPQCHHLATLRATWT